MGQRRPEEEKEPLIGLLDHDVARLKVICGEQNADIILRRFRLWTDPEVDLAVFYVEGLVDRTTVNLAILQPLMILSRLVRPETRGAKPEELLSFLAAQLIPASPATTVSTIDDLIDQVYTGETAILMDGVPKALVVETKTWEHRGITEPSTEAVIRGPREGFNEVLRAGTALLRRRIRDPRLRLDPLKVGRISQTDLVVAWLDGVTDPGLVKEVKRRLKALDIDWVPDSGYIEQYLEDFPYSPFPQFQYTERPDRVAAAVLEGRVAILVDGSPLALIIPGGLSSFLVTAEDYYERFPYGSVLRLLRLGAVIIALTLPAVYIAVTTFHQELLPTTLVLAFAASREPVPFPALLEALLMTGALELTREAGLRLPAPIGQTVGIVAALLLGQASVAAGLASPIMVIVVAITGLASFVAPHYASGLPLRLLSFPLMILAGILGLFGVTAGVVALILHLAGLSSLGIPYLEPLWRPRFAFQDLLIRLPLWMMQRRPSYLGPQDEIRQGPRVRKWAGRPRREGRGDEKP
ncbi:MAG: spore germination protein [Betaproteobacteria bacterium]